MSRRVTYTSHSVSYAAVGASDDPNLLSYPPRGFKAFAENVRLGSGA